MMRTDLLAHSDGDLLALADAGATVAGRVMLQALERERVMVGRMNGDPLVNPVRAKEDFRYVMGLTDGLLFFPRLVVRARRECERRGLLEVNPEPRADPRADSGDGEALE